MVPIDGLGHHVSAQALGLVQRMGHRYDVAGVRLRQLVHEIHDSGQFVDGFSELVIGQFESRQHRDVLDLIFIE